MDLKIGYRSVGAPEVQSRSSRMSRVIIYTAAIVFVIVCELDFMASFLWLSLLSLIMSLGRTVGCCLLLYGIFVSSEWTKQRVTFVVVAIGVIWIGYLQDVVFGIPYYITRISDAYRFGGILVFGVSDYLDMAKVPLLAILTAILIVDGTRSRARITKRDTILN